MSSDCIFCAVERTVTILHCDGDGGDRSEYKYCEISKNRRKANSDGIGLLGWNYPGQSQYAAYAGNLVKGLTCSSLL